MSADDRRPPSRHDEGYFIDEDELRTPVESPVDEARLVDLYRSLVRMDIAGTTRGAVLRSLNEAKGEEREHARFALQSAMADDELVSWIEASAERRKRAIEIAQGAAPPDPSAEQNKATRARITRFIEWGRFAYQVIVVPGYTPLDAKRASPGVHPICRRRLVQALEDVKRQMAPFILVSGANVYPRGTPYYEAIEMKKELLAMGLSEDSILVEARARHSTTNLRNAGRHMLALGLRRAVITTMGGGVGGSDVFDQDFYFSNPNLSTFHARCEGTLGYRVGELSGKGEYHTEFVPSPKVRKINYRTPLDP